MAKKSKKSKSKRVTLRQKYKVIRKVKEHHKKKAKEAKKLGLKNKRKVEKDPGIPNDWPFKEQELKALEARRARALEELEQKKAARKERAQKRKLGLLEDASAKEQESEEQKTNEDFGRLARNRDNSDRAFYKELVKVIEESDVILEVLDARDPLGTRCVDMENMVMKSSHNKHLVLLLNKIDLVPREAVEKWLKYLREEFPTVAFKCSTQEQRSNLGWKSSSKAAKASNILQTSDCLGAETLIKLLKNYSRSHDIKKSITVGIIGLPNVGKSSLINSLKRSHVVNVGATPGLTRSMQEVQLDKNVKLLDCPGVVLLKSVENDASIALRNCKRIEKLDDPISPVKEILKLCPARLLVTLYKTPNFESVDDFLQKVATVRGRLKKGGIIDVDAAARIVLHDWNEGKIAYYTMPPTRNQEEPSESKIVSELGKEFNIDEVYTGETSFIGSLKSVNDFDPVEVPPSCPISFNESMIEGDLEAQPSTRGDENAEDMSDDGEDQPMASEENDTNKANKGKTPSSRQNEKLYTAEGMLNTKMKRAEKKRRKKAGKVDAMDGDYDFKVDYFKKKGSAMDVEDGNGEADDDNQIIGTVPMSGVQLDDE
ncbi:guanine nucleotide-binding protein-like NSN1 [Ricinus communis]|uniref:GTP-binding protein-plant, putative n=1 Tax=Ricinus communis TaxID=3988 RepID=B9S541_RICCO|nr:guanine nucleotide-binding protein-like NSN1 [Ricinus communis]EEF41261.1 GTP-binding protein-plant, putative [Ricinus communis]|eukprot:XP_002521110.1 guanine nucleotide-binding protein-like NSN1 [Ricinus communis]